jgi:hypothetical protein
MEDEVEKRFKAEMIDLMENTSWKTRYSGRPSAKDWN